MTTEEKTCPICGGLGMIYVGVWVTCYHCLGTGKEK